VYALAPALPRKYAVRFISLLPQYGKSRYFSKRKLANRVACIFISFYKATTEARRRAAARLSGFILFVRAEAILCALARFSSSCAFSRSLCRFLLSA
jgi:hypothetical protein